MTSPVGSGVGNVPAQIDAYLNYLRAERGLAANSVNAYRRDLREFADYLSTVGVQSVTKATPAQIAEFPVWLGRTGGKAPSSIARAVSSMRGLYAHLVREGSIPASPAEQVHPPKRPQHLPVFLSIGQVEQLIAAVSGDNPVQIRDRALIELLYGTGARISEAVGLAVDDIPEENLIRLRGKGDKERIVPLGSYARAAIEAYLVRVRPEWASHGTGSPALFLGQRGGPLSRQNAWLILRRAAERAQLGVDISPHTLRHSYATHLIQAGADVRVVQELLGHASVTTTQLYTHVTVDSLRESFASAHPRAREHPEHPAMDP